MNNLFRLLLKFLRKVYLFFDVEKKESVVDNPEEVASIILGMLEKDEPCMISRFGAFELGVVINYLGVRDGRNILKFIRNKAAQWWWNEDLLESLQNNAGFFPIDNTNINRFCQLMLEDMKEVDILGSWLKEESIVNSHLGIHTKSRLLLLEPFWTEYSWMSALKDKKVLVIHPFSETIKSQYERRNLLFENRTILPDFESIHTIKAVQSIGGSSGQFSNWFEALDFMKLEIDSHDYDFALIGCGAYGLPLAAHVKRRGKKAIHLGGSLQLLFGIKGKRWEDESYGLNTFGRKGVYKALVNDFWVSPGFEERPSFAGNVENGCYW